jgi:hypothetical protein
MLNLNPSNAVVTNKRAKFECKSLTAIYSDSHFNAKAATILRDRDNGSTLSASPGHRSLTPMMMDINITGVTVQGECLGSSLETLNDLKSRYRNSASIHQNYMVG